MMLPENHSERSNSLRTEPRANVLVVLANIRVYCMALSYSRVFFKKDGFIKIGWLGGSTHGMGDSDDLESAYGLRAVPVG